ncbi:hypothetical protein PS2_039464 [Malus domestica]
MSVRSPHDLIIQPRSQLVRYVLGVADLDCRMGRMKSNCRKAAMETQQQHIQVDLVLTLMVKFYGGSIFMRELCFQASPKRLQKDRCLDGSGRRSRECCEEGK